MKALVISLVALVLGAIGGSDDVMRKENGTYIVNTTTICNIKGLKGITPVEVYISNNKVVRIEALENKDSKGYFRPLTRRLFPLYEGLGIGEAKELSADKNIDAITGATYSGKALQANIGAALEYYETHR